MQFQFFRFFATTREDIKTRIRFWQDVRKELIALIEERPANKYYYVGLCKALAQASSTGFYKYSHLSQGISMEAMYPELMNHKPKQCWKQNDSYWWNPHLHRSRMRRVEVVDSIIKELEAELERMKVQVNVEYGKSK